MFSTAAELESYVEAFACSEIWVVKHAIFYRDAPIRIFAADTDYRGLVIIFCLFIHFTTKVLIGH